MVEDEIVIDVAAAAGDEFIAIPDSRHLRLCAASGGTMVNGAFQASPESKTTADKAWPLFREMEQKCSSTKLEDYFNEDEWDLEGVESDHKLLLLQEKKDADPPKREVDVLRKRRLTERTLNALSTIQMQMQHQQRPLMTSTPRPQRTGRQTGGCIAAAFA